MNSPIPALRRSIVLLGLVQVFIRLLVRADVTTYPAPAGEAITGDYAVTVNGKPVDVYAAQSEFFEGDYHFATFDFSGKVAIRVTSSQSLARVLIDNVKICGSRMINDDALDLVNTQNATVRNCFFRTQDDSIAIKGLAKMPRPCENILIEDCEFWTDVANIFRIGYECETAGMRNIRARNIEVLYYSKNYRPPTHYWANAIIWLQPNQDMVMADCHFENIRVRSNGDDILMLMAKPMRCMYGDHKNPEPGALRNCSFKNLQVGGEQGDFRGLPAGDDALAETGPGRHRGLLYCGNGRTFAPVRRLPGDLRELSLLPQPLLSQVSWLPDATMAREASSRTVAVRLLSCRGHRPCGIACGLPA